VRYRRDMDGLTAVTTRAAAMAAARGVVVVNSAGNEALRATSSQAASPDNLLGWGILDAVAAVDLDLKPPSESKPAADTAATQ